MMENTSANTPESHRKSRLMVADGGGSGMGIGGGKVNVTVLETVNPYGRCSGNGNVPDIGIVVGVGIGVGVGVWAVAVATDDTKLNNATTSATESVMG